MAGGFKDFITMLSDSRIRTVLMFTTILLAVGIVFGFLKLHGSKPGASGSKVGSAPGGIQSIPGGFGGTPESAEYARLQAQQNVAEAKRAARTGQSAIPTLISSSSLGNQGFANQQTQGTAEPVGCVAPGTKVYSANCQVIGTLGPDGIVQSSQQNNQIGHLVYGPNGQVIGRVGPNGEVLNAQGQIIAHVLPNGDVVNAQGQDIGKVSDVMPGQVVYGADGKPIGRVGPNGEVFNSQGQVIGRMGVNGDAFNAQGQDIGGVTKAGKLSLGTPVYDAYGNLLGTIGPNGKLIPASAASRAAAPAQQAGVRPGTLPAVAGGANNPAMKALIERQAAQLNAAEMQQAKQQLQSRMAAQVGQLISAWAPPTQQYVAGTEKTAAGERSGTGKQGEAGEFALGSTGSIVKAGSIMFAVLDTSVSSDEPGPILATISSGPLKGGKLLGSLTNQREKIMITFHTLNYNDFPTSVSVNAVAIDPATARTGLSDYTNNHYLLRYGTMFAASFMQGYAQAVSQSGSTIVSNGFNTQKNMPTLSPSGEVVVALGNVGTQYTALLNQLSNVPPSVYVYSGTGVGVLVLNDLKLPSSLPE